MEEPTEKEIVEMAMKFLSRVQLTGQEVPAFNSVMRYLENGLSFEE